MYEQLNNKIMNAVKQSLETDVLRTVQAVQRQEIKRTVYGVYTPRYYERRYQNTGLLKKENITGKTTTTLNSARLTVTNETKFNRDLDEYLATHNGDGSEYLAPLIVKGHLGHIASGGSGYTYPRFGAGYMNPRDFVSATRSSLNSSKAHVNSLKKSLSKKGVDVK